MKTSTVFAAMMVVFLALGCSSGDTPNMTDSATQQAASSATATATQQSSSSSAATEAATQQAAASSATATATSSATATATQQSLSSSATATATQQESKQMLSITKVPAPTFTLTKGFDKFSAQEESSFASVLSQYFYSVETRMGISAAIFSGERLWSGTEGFASENVPMRSDTPISVMSSSKTFLTALILKHVDDGLYNLDDRLSELLSGHQGYERLNAKIIADATVEELLLMTAGHADKDTSSGGSQLNYVVAKPNWVPSDTITLTVSPARPSGSYEYSNTSSYLLGLIAQYQSQTDLNELYQSELLERLSIQAGLRPVIEIPDDMALPHADFSKYGGAPGWGELTQMMPLGVSPGYTVNFFEQDGRLAWSAAGIVSTPENMARWAYELLSPNGKVLSATSRNLLVNSFIEKPVNLSGVIQNYGYHLARREYKLSNGSTFVTYGHPGGGGGYGSVLYYSPALDMAVSVVANSELGYQRADCGDARTGDYASPLVCTARGLFESVISD